MDNSVFNFIFFGTFIVCILAIFFGLVNSLGKDKSSLIHSRNEGGVDFNSYTSNSVHHSESHLHRSPFD